MSKSHYSRKPRRNCGIFFYLARLASQKSKHCGHRIRFRSKGRGKPEEGEGSTRSPHKSYSRAGCFSQRVEVFFPSFAGRS